MSLETELIAKLEATSAVTSLTSTARIYMVNLPQKPTLPAAVMQRISGPRLKHLSGASGRGVARIQIDSWALTYLVAQQLAAAIRTALHGYAGKLTTLEVAITLDNERDDYDDDLKWYRVIQDYLINHSE